MGTARRLRARGPVLSGRTGLGPLEIAVLEAVDGLGGTTGAGRRRTDRVLERLEREHGIGPRYAYPVVLDLGTPWRLHLPLLDPNGNWGSQHGDPAADARYTEVRLSPAGALALAAERGELGPVPLGLIEGSLYRDGSVPPFAPRAVLAALRSGSGDAGPPVLPTGGRVAGEVEALLAGRRARLTLSCTVVREPGALVVTEVPLGVEVDRVEQSLSMRYRSLHPGPRRYADYLPPDEPIAAPPFTVTDVQDESSMRVGLRVVCRLAPGSDLDAAEAWLRSVWPVTVEVAGRLPAPMRRRLQEWDAGDGSGLAALSASL